MKPCCVHLSAKDSDPALQRIRLILTEPLLHVAERLQNAPARPLSPDTHILCDPLPSSVGWTASNKQSTVMGCAFRDRLDQDMETT